MALLTFGLFNHCDQRERVPSRLWFCLWQPDACAGDALAGIVYLVMPAFIGGDGPE